ncbi:MAG: restriction endonuclease subunit S [Thiobacillaceae bacterium]
MIDLPPEQLAIVRRLLAAQVPECEVRAFGSRVAWTAKSHSDLDLALVGPAKIASSKLRHLREAFEESGLSVRVDLLDWHAISENFQKVIAGRYEVVQKAAYVNPARAQWEILPLGELTENLDGRRVPVKELDRKPGPYPYYGASGIVDRVDGYLFDGEYLLIGEDGENLRTRQTPIAFMAKGKFWVNNHAHIVRGNHRADTRFLSYVLSQTDISGYLTGSTMPKLTQGNLNRLPVVVPPLAEQKAIAAVLGALDDKIELNRRMNATLEAMARALFQSWFVDFDPVRAKLDGRKPVGLDEATAALLPAHFQDTEAGHIPKGWTIQPVGEVVDCVGGGTPSTTEPKYWEGGTHHWTTPKDFSSLQAPVLLNTDRKLTDAGIAKISSGLLPAGTLLLSSRAPVGYLAIAAMPVAINQGFIALKCNERASNFFMLNWCQTNMAEIESRATGTTFAEISKQNFRPIRVVLPPKELMAAFTAKVAPLYAQITANLHQSRTLATLRDTLLPKLLSGELSVTEAQEAEVSA